MESARTNGIEVGEGVEIIEERTLAAQAPQDKRAPPIITSEEDAEAALGAFSNLELDDNPEFSPEELLSALQGIDNPSNSSSEEEGDHDASDDGFLDFHALAAAADELISPIGELGDEGLVLHELPPIGGEFRESEQDHDSDNEEEELLLEPIGDLDNIFEEEDEHLSEEPSETYTQPNEQQTTEIDEQHFGSNLDILDSFPVTDEETAEALELLAQLERFSISDPYSQNSTTPGTMNDMNEDDGLPPFLYCQPCTPELEANPLQEQLDAYFPNSINTADEPLAADDREYKNEHDPPVSNEIAHRPQAVKAAEELAQVMGSRCFDPTVEADRRKKQVIASERLLLGHKERILGCDLSPCGQFLATASQDGTARIFSTSNSKCISTILQSKDHECLRVAWREIIEDEGYMLATGGADGWVHLHQSQDCKEWTKLTSIDHNALRSFSPTDDPDDRAQIYSLQFVHEWLHQEGNFLLTSSDDHVHLWELEESSKKQKVLSEEQGLPAAASPDSKAAPTHQQCSMKEVLSFKFDDLHTSGYGVSIQQVAGQAIFGGAARNPQNLIYVFDANYSHESNLLGVALSDGSLRLLNGRGVCVAVLQLPGVNSHLTCLAWNTNGTQLATCVATGHVITWEIQLLRGTDQVGAKCRAILEGGHDAGRPLFGTLYWGKDLLLSWGVDGRLCLWDALAEEEVQTPLGVLLHKSDYPIYAASQVQDTLALAGGGGESGFVGIPAFLYKIPPLQEESALDPGLDIKSLPGASSVTGEAKSVGNLKIVDLAANDGADSGGKTPAVQKAGKDFDTVQQEKPADMHVPCEKAETNADDTTNHTDKK